MEKVASFYLNMIVQTALWNGDIETINDVDREAKQRVANVPYENRDPLLQNILCAVAEFYIKRSI